MPYWVFHEEQLQAAMRTFARQLGESGAPVRDFQLVYDFLKSDAAREHKLIVEEKR